MVKSQKLKKLTSFRKNQSGRANGKIILAYRGGGRRRRYRFLDFKRSRFSGEKATVKRIHRDPFRTPLIGTLLFGQGYITQIILAEGSQKGDEVFNDIGKSFYTPKLISSSIKIKNAPAGNILYGLEIYPQNGQKIARAAGTSAILLKGEFYKVYRRLKLKSGEIRLLHENCMASIGITSNSSHFLKNYSKAGTSRQLNRRPRVRAYAMNPVDHPMGGRTKGGTPAKSKKGLLSTKSTRNNSRTEKFILLGQRSRKFLKR